MSDSEGDENPNDGISFITIAETYDAKADIVDVVSTESSIQIKDRDEQRSTLICTSKDEAVEKETVWEKETKAINDDAVTFTYSDICRICHMGSFPPVTNNRPAWEWQNRTHQNSSQVSTLSCYAYLGPLISACMCRGTVGLVHAECIERWLTESGHSRCELCGYKYATEMVPRYNFIRSIGIGFNTMIATRQMFLDVVYLIVTTPLALFSCYICASAIKLICESRMKDIPWSVVVMLPTCCLTLFAYWGWLLTLSRIHGRRWRRYLRNNFVIRLIPDNVDIYANDDRGT